MADASSLQDECTVRYRAYPENTFEDARLWQANFARPVREPPLLTA